MTAPAAVYRLPLAADAPTERRRRLQAWAADYGRLCGRDFTALPLAESKPGQKPRFLGDTPCFSLSHSGDLLLCAFSLTPVGLDLEKLRPLPQAPALARRFFHPQEREWLAGKDALFFFLVWTAKEAAVKWSGQGINQNFPRFSVIPAFCRNQPIRLEGQDLALQWLTPEPGYIACLATTPPRPPLRLKNGGDG